MSRLICIAIAVALLAGCASGGPSQEITQYLLRPPVQDQVTAVKPAVRIGIGRITLPEYLKTSSLMVETAEREIRPARYHEWAEPLDRSLAVVLAAVVSSALGMPVLADGSFSNDWDYTINVYIDQFHGTLDGQVRLSGGWTLVPADSAVEPERFQYATTEPLTSDGYAALVDAHYRLAERLGAKIADSLAARLDAGNLSAARPGYPAP